MSIKALRLKELQQVVAKRSKYKNQNSSSATLFLKRAHLVRIQYLTTLKLTQPGTLSPPTCDERDNSDRKQQAARRFGNCRRRDRPGQSVLLTVVSARKVEDRPEEIHFQLVQRCARQREEQMLHIIHATDGLRDDIAGDRIANVKVKVRLCDFVDAEVRRVERPVAEPVERYRHHQACCQHRRNLVHVICALYDLPEVPAGRRDWPLQPRGRAWHIACAGRYVLPVSLGKIQSARPTCVIERLRGNDAAKPIRIWSFSIIPTRDFIGTIHHDGLDHASVARVRIHGERRRIVARAIEQRRAAGNDRRGETCTAQTGGVKIRAPAAPLGEPVSVGLLPPVAPP